MKLKIGTYNICHCCDFTKFTPPDYERDNYVVNIEQTARIIKQLNLDIIGLNEVYENGNDPLEAFKHQTEILAKLSGYPYFYYAQGKDYDFTDIGNAILSKYPIESVTSHKILSVPECEQTEDTWYEDRVIIDAVINVNGTKVNALITHFGLATVELERMTAKINQLIDNAVYPVVLMGDFNIEPDSEYLTEIYKRLVSCADVFNNQQNTFPAWKPEVHIDYIFVNKNTKVLGYTVHDILASDHVPLSAEIEL